MSVESMKRQMISTNPRDITHRQLNSLTTVTLHLLERLRDELIRRNAQSEQVNLALLEFKNDEVKH